MKKTILLTQHGYEKAKNEYEDLQNKREVAVKELQIARDMGDRSENGAYKSARFKLSSLDRRIRELSKIVKNAKVVHKTKNGIIEIGSVVTVLKYQEELVYEIVGGYESDINNGKLSYLSPIGRAFIGKRVGTTVLVCVPAGEIEYKILKVE